MKMAIRKNTHNVPQGPLNPGFMQEKVQKGDFLKKKSLQELIFLCFMFPRRPETLNKKRVFFWVSKTLQRQCAVHILLQTNHFLYKLSISYILEEYFWDLGWWNFGSRYHESIVLGPLVGQYIALGKRAFRICQKVMEFCHYGSFTHNALISVELMALSMNSET